MDDEKLLQHLSVAFEYAHKHEDWVSPLEAELACLTHTQALWKPAPDATSIWEIVLHMAVWNENIVERIETGENTHPTEGAWPAPSDVTEAGWESAKARLRNSILLVENLLKSTTLQKIEDSPYGPPDLLVRYTHLGYHGGQIVKQKEELERKGVR